MEEGLSALWGLGWWHRSSLPLAFMGGDRRGLHRWGQGTDPWRISARVSNQGLPGNIWGHFWNWGQVLEAPGGQGRCSLLDTLKCT